MVSLPLTWKKESLNLQQGRGQEEAREHTIADVAFLFNNRPDSKKVVIGKGKESL